MTESHLKHIFIKKFPESLEEGVLYISIEYGTAVHKCCCGCGEKVFTPFSPDFWKITYDGESISLYPSIGNWSFECKSHYFIKNDKVVIAEPLTSKITQKSDEPIRKNSTIFTENTQKQGILPKVRKFLSLFRKK